MKTNSTHPCYEAHDKAAAGKCQSEIDQGLKTWLTPYTDFLYQYE